MMNNLKQIIHFLNFLLSYKFLLKAFFHIFNLTKLFSSFLNKLWDISIVMSGFSNQSNNLFCQKVPHSFQKDS